MPNLSLPNKLEPLLTKKKRFKVIIGGRGSGKSMSVASILLLKAQTEQANIMCAREFQNSVSDSVHALLISRIEDMEVHGASTTNNEITFEEGGNFIFRGLARNPESLKSLHGTNYCWVEEAQTISEKSLKLLTPTIREDDSELWFTANPQSSADPFSQKFIKPFEKELLANGFYEDDLHLVIKMDYKDNPWFPDVLEQERINDLKLLKTAEYNHIWNGAFNDTIDNSLISVEWFDACIDAHKVKGFKAMGQKIISHDPSGEGEDDKGLVVRHGSIITHFEAMSTGDANEGCDWATSRAISENADIFTYDGDGLGLSLKRQVIEQLQNKKIDIDIFHGGGAVEDANEEYQKNGKAKGKKNKFTFKNKRAQFYWRLRERMYATYRAVVMNEYIDPDLMLSIDSEGGNIDQLRAEVCRIPLKPNPSGIIQLMSKPDMKKIGIASPNISDSLAMSMIIPAPPKKILKMGGNRNRGGFI